MFFFYFLIYQKSSGPFKMSNINVVQSCWNFAKLSKISKEPKFEVSCLKNKNLAPKCVYQKVWKLLFYLLPYIQFFWPNSKLCNGKNLQVVYHTVQAFLIFKKTNNWCIKLKENVLCINTLNIAIFLGSQVTIGTCERMQKIYQRYGILTKPRNMCS